MAVIRNMKGKYAVQVQVEATTVVGVDVGGSRKGFHAVALRGGMYLDCLLDRSPSKVSEWCRNVGAKVIAIDAPCRWSKDGRARPAERELMKERIWCFSTPMRNGALNHPNNHYEWMLNGERLYDAISESHPLFLGAEWDCSSSICIEVFPHAIACAISGRILSARNKKIDRQRLLSAAEINIGQGRSMDLIDAAVCALSSHYFTLGCIKTYGDPDTGLIAVPNLPH